MSTRSDMAGAARNRLPAGHGTGHPVNNSGGVTAAGSEVVTLALPAAVLEALAQRVAAILAEQHPPREADEWLGVKEAASYLSCPVSRVYAEVARAKDPRNPNAIPHEREGQRLLFRRGDLDEWVQRGGHREWRVRP